MHWTQWTPLYVVFGFLAFGFAFVAVSDFTEAVGRWQQERAQRRRIEREKQ